MNSVSASIPLALGIIAGVLFALIFVYALVVSMRNRKILHKHAENSQQSTEKR